MKKSIITTLMVLVVGGILVTTGCKKSCGDRSGYIIDKFAKKLDLSAEQTIWLTGFKAEIKNEIEKFKQEKDATHEELKNNFIGGVLSETLINNKIIMKCNALQDKTPYIVAKIAEIHANLNSEQRSTLVEIAQKFHDKKERRKKGCKFFKSDGLAAEKISSHIKGKIKARLDLSDDQNEWIETFITGIIEDPALKSTKDELHTARKQVCETLTAEFVNESFNEDRITELFKENLPVELIKNLGIASKVVEIQSNLNAEQRIELVAMIKKHKEKRRGCWIKRQCFSK